MKDKDVQEKLLLEARRRSVLQLDGQMDLDDELIT